MTQAGQVTGLRNGSVVIGTTYQGQTDEIPIAIAVFPCVITVQPTTLTAAASGGLLNVTVTVTHGQGCA